MAVVDILMPRMGESVMEGTIIKWIKNVGEEVEEEEAIIEVATDKVDTDIPSPFKGKLIEQLVQEGDVVPVGNPIGKLETEAVEKPANSEQSTPKESIEPPKVTVPNQTAKTEAISMASPAPSATPLPQTTSGRFYSPLVLNIARKEGIDMVELDTIPGSGKEGRVTKKDILNHLASRSQETPPTQATPELPSKKTDNSSTEGPIKPESTLSPSEPEPVKTPALGSYSGAYDILEMNRTRKIIAERMLDSKRISPHVTSFVEADVTNIVYWRNRWKQHFKDKENTALTFTPIFIEAVVKAIKDYPMVNVSVDGDRIIVKKDINVGMAVALPDGNLIVPVIRNADQLNIVGLTTKVNDLARRARAGKLGPEDLEGGTYTVTNVGSFGNAMGTPILVQPQVGIMALGAVVKKPAVIETPHGDTIGIRHMMFLSHSYDHRVVDGSLGGMFVRRVADHLERFDLDRKV